MTGENSRGSVHSLALPFVFRSSSSFAPTPQQLASNPETLNYDDIIMQHAVIDVGIGAVYKLYSCHVESNILLLNNRYIMIILKLCRLYGHFKSLLDHTVVILLSDGGFPLEASSLSTECGSACVPEA